MTKMWIRLMVTLSMMSLVIACGKSKSEDSVQAPPVPKADTSKDTGSDQNGGLPPGAPGDKTPQSQGQTEHFGPRQSGRPGDRAHRPRGQDSSPGLEVSRDPFSGSANDYLRSYLNYKMDQVSGEQKTRNQSLAERTQKADLKIDFDGTGDVALVLKVASQKKPQRIQTIILGGTMDRTRRAQLRSDEPGIAVGDVQCLDVLVAGRRTCETAKVSVRSLNSKADLEIIFRRTDVKLSSRFPSKVCVSNDCAKLQRMFYLSAEAPRSAGAMKKAKLETFEIIGGRSGFRFVLVTNLKQVLTVSGPLLNPAQNPNMNILADRSLNMDELVDLDHLGTVKTDLQEALKEVRITGNDGKGAIQLHILIDGRYADGQQEQVDLKIQRISTDINPIAERVGSK